ncbi:MAG: BMP family ABC transporter substrate-binding protein [Myxococcota bacterium]|nr:BMP family ABC transporter substrate-binding protein [Myxococcota bacterium]
MTGRFGFNRVHSARRLRSRLACAVWVSVLLCGCGDLTPTLHVFYAEGGKGDRGINDSAYLGALDAHEEASTRLVQWSPRDKDEAGIFFTEVLADSATAGDELLVLVSDTYSSLVSQVQCQFRTRLVLHLDGASSSCDKVRSVDYKVFAASYLAGVLAAQASETGRVAAIGGVANDEVIEAVSGFSAGVESQGAEVVKSYLPAFADGFNNYDEGYRVASVLQLDDEVDVIYAVAGATSLGILEAVKDGMAASGEQRYFIGHDYDHSPFGGNVVLASVIKRVEVEIVDAMNAVNAGSFTSGHVQVGIEEGHVEVVLNPSFVALGGSFRNALATAVQAETAYRGDQ